MEIGNLVVKKNLYLMIGDSITLNFDKEFEEDTYVGVYVTPWLQSYLNVCSFQFVKKGEKLYLTVTNVGRDSIKLSKDLSVATLYKIK